MNALLSRLAGRRVAVDTGPFQRYVHGDRRTLALFEHIEAGAFTALTSVLTLGELLVEPYARREEDLVKELNFLFPTFPHLALVPVNQAIADRAAAFRSHARLDFLSSLQVATAVVEKAECFVTTDASLLERVPELDIVVL